MENPFDPIYKKITYTNAFELTSDLSNSLLGSIDKFLYSVATPTLNPMFNVRTRHVAPVPTTKTSSNNYVNPNNTHSLNDINTHPTNRNATIIPSSLPTLMKTFSTLKPESISNSRNTVNNSWSTSGAFITTASVVCAFVFVVIMGIYTIYRLRVHNKKIKSVQTAVYNHYQYYLEENIKSKNPSFKNRGTNSTCDTTFSLDAKITTHSALEQGNNLSPSLLSVRLPIKHSRLLQLGVERNQMSNNIINGVHFSDDANSRSSISSYSTLTSHDSIRHTGTNTYERFNRVDNYPHYKNNIYNHKTNQYNQNNQIYFNKNLSNRNHANCGFSEESSFGETLSMNQFFGTASAPVLTPAYNITTTTSTSSYHHHHDIASQNHNNCEFDEESSVGEPFTMEQLFDGLDGTAKLNHENTSKEKCNATFDHVVNDSICHVELSEIYPNRGSVFEV